MPFQPNKKNNRPKGKTTRVSKKAAVRPKRNTAQSARPARKPKTSTAPEGMVRIQKVLAEAGVASRRAAEEMILEGRVAHNGKQIQSLPCFVNPLCDDIRVDGRKLKTAQSAPKRYYLMNKSKGVVCTSSDPLGRPTAVGLLKENQRLHCVGRLDADSTGLLILTNDGELTQHLTHPKYEVPKTYLVTIGSRLESKDIDQIKRGVYLDGRRTAGAAVKILKRNPTGTLLQITLREGRNREIRRTLLRLGHKVRKLKRTAIGPITDIGLKIGAIRELTSKEIQLLRKSGKSL